VVWGTTPLIMEACSQRRSTGALGAGVAGGAHLRLQADPGLFLAVPAMGPLRGSLQHEAGWRVRLELSEPPEELTAGGEHVTVRAADDSLISTRPRSIVLGMARSEPVAPDDLFSFTQVTVTRLDAPLAAASITLTVAPIRRSPGA